MIRQTTFNISPKRRGCHLITQEILNQLPYPLPVGLCGGLTTFSTFSKEALTMLQTGQTWGFATYIALSVIAGIALVALGYHIAR